MRLFFFAAMLLSPAFGQVPAMPGAVPLPLPNVQLFDNNGKPCAGCLLYTYAAGTTTPLATYTNSTANTPNANPLVLDSSGRGAAWIQGQAYKLVLKTAAGVQLWTSDNVTDTTFFYIQHLKYISDSSLLSYRLPGAPAGSVTRTVQAKLGESVSILDFGAVCDGSTDNSVALQNAINAAAGAGQTLFIPPGTATCKYGTTLHIASPLDIWGSRHQQYTLGTTLVGLQYTGTGTAIEIKASAGYMYRVNLRDFGLFSTGSAAIGIEADDLEEFTFSGLQLGTQTGGFGTGIYCGHCGTGTIRNNALSYNAIGINFDNVASANNIAMQVRANNIFMSSTAAIKIGDMVSGTISGNYTEGFQNALLIDTNTKVGGAQIINLRIAGEDYSNGGHAYTQPRLLKMVSLDGSKQLTWVSGSITDISSYLGSPGGDYSIEVDMASNTALHMVSNVSISGATLYGSGVAGIYADTGAVNFHLRHVQSASAYASGYVPNTAGSVSTVEWEDATGTEIMTGNLTVQNAPSTTVAFKGGSAQSGPVLGIYDGDGVLQAYFDAIGGMGLKAMTANTAAFSNPAPAGGTNRDVINIQTAAKNRWTMTNAFPEAGANAGSSLCYGASADDGSFLGTVACLDRATLSLQVPKFNYIATETGAANAIAGSIPNFTPVYGSCMTIQLAHSLQAGANTFVYGGAISGAIRSHLNPYANIALPYAASGMIQLCLSPVGVWLDMAQ